VYFAEDPFTQRLITASSAVAGSLYNCPVCRGKVFLRSGGRRAAHFAHLHKTARPECELYHPGLGGYSGADDKANSRRPSLPQSRDNLAGARIRLMLSTASRLSGRAGRAAPWSLVLSLPRLPPATPGSIDVTVGLMASHKLALRDLTSANKVLSVRDPDAGSFRVRWFSPEVPQVFRQQLEEPVQGLSKRYVTVFSRGRLSLHARVQDHLEWGRPYFCVYHADSKQVVDPVLDQLNPQRLTSFHDWQCLLVTLPFEPNATLTDTLCKLTNLNDVVLSARGAVLWPASLARQQGGLLLGAGIDDLWVTIWKTDEDEGELTAHTDYDYLQPELPWAASGQATLRLSGLKQASNVDISVDSLEVCSVSRGAFSSSRAPCAGFSFRVNGGVINQVPFFSLECQKLLLAVQEEAATLVSIDASAGMRGFIECVPFKAGLGVSKGVERTGILGAARLINIDSDLDISTINGMIQKGDNDVFFSFTGLGVVCVRARNRFLKEHSAINLSDEVRAQIIWLCNAVSDNPALHPESTSEELIDKLTSITDPGVFLPQYDAILRWLENNRGRGYVDGRANVS
jgi:hypothetical protein